jgi:hypothetical protein
MHVLHAYPIQLKNIDVYKFILRNYVIFTNKFLDISFFFK